MNKLLILLAVLVSAGFMNFSRETDSDNDHLFRIVENDKTGYIDAEGKILIKPAFRDAGNFKEGLAAARLHGSYGYIDKTGNFAIAPAFDYATEFSEGMAIVYLKGKPVYIDKSGEQPFPVSFFSIQPFKNGTALVHTKSRKTGIINKQGKLVIDTVFSTIQPFSNGLAGVSSVPEKIGSDYNYGSLKAGVIDASGNFVVPFGRYSGIGEFINGYATVRIAAQESDQEGTTAKSGVINEKGEEMFLLDRKNNSWLDGNVHAGLIKIYLYNFLGPVVPGIYSTENTYQGFINLKGQLVLNDPKYRYVHDFSEGRAFVQDKDRNYFLIDTNGKLVTQMSFRNVHEGGFKNGIAFVETENGWGSIDRNGKFVIKPVFEQIESPGLFGDYFFFTENKDDDKRLTGIADKTGKIVLKPKLRAFSPEGFKNGILAAQINDRLCYLNTEGKIVWEQKPDGAEKRDLNIDFMNRGYFRAYSAVSVKNKNDLGGYAASGNYPKKIERNRKFTANALSVVALPENKKPWSGTVNGFEILVVNNTKNNMDFEAQDSRLDLKIQALDRNGKWKDIEYLPSSWCGNSYHTVTLSSNHYWSFTVPVYDGEFKTKLRAELTYPDPADKLTEKERWERQQKTLVVYSNTFDGAINPGQFWRKREYTPNGIMDPYNE